VLRLDGAGEVASAALLRTARKLMDASFFAYAAGQTSEEQAQKR
jgi:hypothetical protein